MGQSSIASRNAALLARNNLLDDGKLEIRTGAAADIDATPSGVLLETITLPASVFANPVNGAALANAIAQVLAQSNAPAGEKHYIGYDSLNNPVRNGSAGTSGTDLILSSDSWSIGEPVSVTSWVTGEAK